MPVTILHTRAMFIPRACTFRAVSLSVQSHGAAELGVRTDLEVMCDDMGVITSDAGRVFKAEAYHTVSYPWSETEITQPTIRRRYKGEV